MEGFDMAKAGVRVGLEVHQQLDTGKKLFCKCRPAETEEYTSRFTRKLRAAKGELGEVDAAALFERSKSKSITYYANPQSSCLVERDEEPPRGLDADARRTALIIASALGSKVFGEIYPMRKTVVDGSNTTGFQRTMLVSEGGGFDVGGVRVGIQSICLEEDAAKNLGDEGSARKFGLGRLGIPLVEIATEPFEAGSPGTREAALALGRILRSSKRVRRGLGSIRQDVNVSIKGGDTVVEVKGVQQLDQLEAVVEYEAKRQAGLLQISARLKESGWSPDKDGRHDVTGLFAACSSKIIKGAIKGGQRIFAARFAGMGGMFGYSPYEGIRLGRDVAELVRFFGLGGVFHSDELPNYGVTQQDVDALKKEIGAVDGDAFLLLACPEEMVGTVLDHVTSRIAHVKDSGIPADTRLATVDGQTRFLRPRPGAARMYPETDVPPVTVEQGELDGLKGEIPKPWDESIAELQERFGLNLQLAEQVFDSRYAALFEEIASGSKVSPTFVASSLCSTITSLEREGMDSGLLPDHEIKKAFELLGQGKIAKESVGIVFGSIMSGKAGTVEDAVAGLSMGVMDQASLRKAIERIVSDNAQLVANQKERAVGPLMGIAMKELRGKASGEEINRTLVSCIAKRLA